MIEGKIEKRNNNNNNSFLETNGDISKKPNNLYNSRNAQKFNH